MSEDYYLAEESVKILSDRITRQVGQKVGQKVEELVQSGNSELAEALRQIKSERDSATEQKKQQEAEAEQEEMVEGAIKEAGSSLTGLTMLVQGYIEAEQAETRDEDPNIYRVNPPPQPVKREPLLPLPPRKIVERNER